MKRLRVILLFLLLGAIVNVAVAWGLMGAANEFSEPEWIRQDMYSWSILRWKCPGSTILAAQCMALGQSTKGLNTEVPRLPWWCRLHKLPPVEEGQWLLKHDMAAGWPLLSMYLYQDTEMDPVTANTRSQVVHGAVTDLVIPYYVIPGGFIVDTMFYALILSAPFGIFYTCRRVFRRKSGLCVQCAYDLRAADHVACPECGEEIRKGNPA